MLWDVIYSFVIALLVQIVISLFVRGGRYIYNKCIMKKMEFNLNGYWKNTHINHCNDEIIEIVRMKQIKNEIRMYITQYKKESVKKYQGSGVISGNSIASYYCGKEQVGIFLLGIKNDNDGNMWLEGEFLEGVDLNLSRKTREKNVYRLERIKLSVKEKNKLLSCKNKYDTAKEIVR